MIVLFRMELQRRSSAEDPAYYPVESKQSLDNQRFMTPDEELRGWNQDMQSVYGNDNPMYSRRTESESSDDRRIMRVLFL